MFKSTSQDSKLVCVFFFLLKIMLLLLGVLEVAFA